MAKTKTYKDKIRAQVRANHGGEVPKYLDLTIENYAAALQTRDTYRDKIEKDGPTITGYGSMGQPVTKQHPLCGLLYQQEMLCQSYAKVLGLTAAKAATKTEAPVAEEDDPMKTYYTGGRKR